MDLFAGLTASALAETLDALAGAQRAYEAADRYELLSYRTFPTLSAWQWATALGFIHPIDYDTGGEELAIMHPHFGLYEKHLARNSALRLDLGNLWWLHWALCTNDLHLWGWVFHAILQASGPNDDNYFDLKSLVSQYRSAGRTDVPDSVAEQWIKATLRSYAPGGVFAPLGLLEFDDDDTLRGRASRRAPYHLPVRIVVFALVTFFSKWMGGAEARFDDSRITLDLLAYVEGGLGSIFYLPDHHVQWVSTNIEALTTYAPADDPDGAKARLCYRSDSTGAILPGYIDRKHSLGDSIAENMYLLYLAPPHVHATEAAFLRPTFL